MFAITRRWRWHVKSLQFVRAVADLWSVFSVGTVGGADGAVIDMGIFGYVAPVLDATRPLSPQNR